MKFCSPPGTAFRVVSAFQASNPWLADKACYVVTMEEMDATEVDGIASIGIGI